MGLGFGVMKRSATAAALLGIGALVLLMADAASPGWFLVAASQVAASASAGLAAVALVAGIAHLLGSRPDLKRPVAFALIAAVCVFSAHMYIINSPPVDSPSSLSGGVSSSFSNSDLRVVPLVAGTNLSVTVTDVGANAVGTLAVSLNGDPLPSSSFSPEPSVLDPLEPTYASYGHPSKSAATWVLASPPPAGSNLTVDYRYMNCYHVPTPSDSREVPGCIMDETYYVPSALGILQGEQCAPYADSCNLEHPPLGKALIAAGMAVFGVDSFGWRISNVLLGTLCIPLLFALVYEVSGNRRLAYFSSLLFAAETLFFVQSSAGLIDVPAVFFSLLAFILYFHKSSYWKLDNYTAAGILLGLAALSKETAVFALGGIVTYDLLFGGGGLKGWLTRSVTVAAPAVLVFAAGVQVYDSLFASASVPFFPQQVSFMLSYGSSLTCGSTCGWYDSVFNIYISPINWITLYSPVGYLVTTVTVTVSGAVPSTYSYVGVGYYGIDNQIVVWLLYLWLPLAVYRLYRGRRPESPAGPDDRFAGFCSVWFLWSYLPYLALWAYGRVTYPFYLVPAIPPLAAGAAYFVTRDWFPRKMAVLYVAAAFGLLFLYFPVKDFLPDMVRVWLGR
jgi:4-amino-4-deoxy-L-arabinose transferase-like glycosyltransferase